jgi:hypothetical protein
MDLKRNLKQYLTKGISMLWMLIWLIPQLSGQTITISEINYKSDKSRNAEDWIELWNYGQSSVDLSQWILQGEKFNEFYMIPNGTVVGPDKRIVLARNTEMFKEIYPEVNPLGPFVFRLSGKGQNIRLYDKSNTLFQEIWYRDTLPWPKSPDGHGKTLELLDPYGDYNDGRNWIAGCIMGTPGKPPGDCKETIVFSEVFTANYPPYETGDWVELKNTGNSPKDISNWTFTNRKDSNSFIIPPGTVIQPGEYLVLIRRNKFKDYHTVSKTVGPFEFGLRNEREIIKLYDAEGKIYNSMYYDNTPPWPFKSATEPVSLELVDGKKSLCLPSNWMDGCYGGSPGKAFNPNDAVCALDIEKITRIKPLGKIAPNPFSNYADIEINIDDLQTFKRPTLKVFDFTGKEALAEHIIAEQAIIAGNGNITFRFHRNGLPPGMYFINISDSGKILSAGKVVIVD